MARFTECDDYVNSIQVPQLIKASKLQNGSPEMNGIRPVMYTGGYCAVFPYIANNKKYAVRCWHANLDGVQERTYKIAEFISSVKLPYFVNFEYVDEGIATPKGVMPIVIMDWVDAKPLKTFISQIVHNSLALDSLASNFLTMARKLHDNGVSHGDLQHGNILVKSNGDLVLVDYDSMYVPSLKGYPNEISGLRGYQHPARWTTKKASPKADYFSELIIYTSIKALSKFPELWDDLQMSDTDTLIFSGEDIDSQGGSDIFNRLSADPYLKDLVDLIREALTFSSIEELKPLESLEPNLRREEEKNRIVNEIKNLLNALNEKTVNEIKEWLVNIENRTLDEACAKYVQVQDLIKRQREIDELSKEWNDNGYRRGASEPINTKPSVDEDRNIWNDSNVLQQVNLSTSYRKTDVDDVRNQWNK